MMTLAMLMFLLVCTHCLLAARSAPCVTDSSSSTSVSLIAGLGAGLAAGLLTTVGTLIMVTYVMRRNRTQLQREAPPEDNVRPLSMRAAVEQDDPYLLPWNRRRPDSANASSSPTSSIWVPPSASLQANWIPLSSTLESS